MDSENCECRLEVGLPTIPRYSDASFITSCQSEYHLQSMDGLPRAQPDHQHLSSTPILYPAYNYSTHLPLSHNMTQWSSSTTQPLANVDNYGYEPPGIYQEPSFQSPHALTPRYCPKGYGSFNNSLLSASFDGSSYILDSARDELQNPGLAYDVDNTLDFNLNNIHMNPHPTIEHGITLGRSYSMNASEHARFLRSDSSDDGGLCSREMTTVDVDETGTDEPYAKLIWRALMSAPDHSMVLQEIYQWFRDNTTKGDSDTKGWMNSIRHNLSMNAAFRKTERKSTGEESKKSTEWVLEDFAIKEGVQSTTRYRKGNSNKKYHKSGIPAPARQISGSKGGNATRDHSNHLKRQRCNERSDHRDYNRRPIVDSRNISQYHEVMASQRQISPITPNQDITHSPYFLKNEHFDTVLSEEAPLYQGLENVQGIFMDHDTPLFSTEHDSPFPDPQLMYSQS